MSQSSRSGGQTAIEAMPRPGAYLLTSVAQAADYWIKGAREHPDHATAILALEQAVNAYKNAAYDFAEKLHFAGYDPTTGTCAPLPETQRITANDWHEVQSEVHNMAQRIERLQNELLIARHERARAEAAREEAVKQLTGIFALLDPPDTQVEGKTLRFVNPHAAEVLHALSDRIRAIPDAMRSASLSARPCTCHPDDNPPRPCPQKYALTECREAAARSTTQPRPKLTRRWAGSYDSWEYVGEDGNVVPFEEIDKLLGALSATGERKP